ncbi:MAG: LuxR family transcriptional regulator, partial [Rhodospirillales bacterium]|nr:LuxR family transcriptional regulator [Rhodospirillales bacterium]
MNARIGDYVSNLKEMADLGGLRQVFASEAERIGFNRFAYVGMHLPGKGNDAPVIVSTFPEAWTDHYIEKRYQHIDPVFLGAHRSLLPVTWNDLTARDLSRPQRAVIDEAKEFGLLHGLTIPVHGHGGEFGLISMTSDCSQEAFDSILREDLHTLHLMAIHYHDAVGRTCTANAPVQERQLTGREVECLVWTSQGKTAWEISAILKISERTVKFHLQNAAQKL